MLSRLDRIPEGDRRTDERTIAISIGLWRVSIAVPKPDKIIFFAQFG